MAKTLSLDLRERVVAAVSQGMSCRQAAVRFGVSPASAIRWCSLQRDTGSPKAKPQGGDRRSGPIEAQACVILSLLKERSDITLKELQAELDAAGYHFGIGTLWRFFDRHARTWKKTAHASEQDRPNVAQHRQSWRAEQGQLDSCRLIFIDETWAATNMARLYGRAPKGQRLRASIPHGHYKSTTFVAGLRLRGMTAPMVLDGPINGSTFQAYVDQILVPELGRSDIVVMDNLSSHKGAGIRAAIEAAGAKLVYLPPYSPDLNPIENAFSKLKAGLRKASERTVESLWNTIGALIPTFTPRECANFFKAAGYDLIEGKTL